MQWHNAVYVTMYVHVYYCIELMQYDCTVHTCCRRQCYSPSITKGDELQQTSTATSSFEQTQPCANKVPEMDEVVEENGPVDYCLEDGLDDRELEQLAYEGDPLLQTEYDDEGMPLDSRWNEFGICQHSCTTLVPSISDHAHVSSLVPRPTHRYARERIQ